MARRSEVGFRARHRLRERRVELGFSQTVLAARVSIPQVTLGRIERGEAVASPDRRRALAVALACPAEELFESAPVALGGWPAGSWDGRSSTSAVDGRCRVFGSGLRSLGFRGRSWRGGSG
jgi:DNA-binding XRE family transcriptional regulator